MVSIASTLGFEAAYCGARACFFADEVLLRQFGPWYTATGVDPFRDAAAVVSFALSAHQDLDGRAYYERVLSSQYRGRNSARIAELIVASLDGTER